MQCAESFWWMVRVTVRVSAMKRVVLMEEERREWETPLHTLHYDPERFL